MLRFSGLERLALSPLGDGHVPHLLLDTGSSAGCMLSAPKGRPNKAQANGLGQKGHPFPGFQALKGRDKSIDQA
jgi:hypothetical protein